MRKNIVSQRGEGKAVAYGSLYMDEGEGWNVVIKQLDYIMQPNVSGLFFDVIDWKMKQEAGEKMVSRIRSYVAKHYSNLEIVSIDYTATEETRETPRN